MRLYREDLPLRFIKSRMLPITLMKRPQYPSHHTYRYTILVLFPYERTVDTLRRIEVDIVWHVRVSITDSCRNCCVSD
jgi:hypothetical protein